MRILESAYLSVIALLKAAQARNEELQSQYELGSPEWHSCETIDGKIHEALTLLGD